MTKPIALTNGREWSSQTKALAFFKEMLGRYKIGDIVTDSDDHWDLVALLERYDALISDDPAKIGLGVRHFEKRLNRDPKFKTAGFWVIRTDGQASDFSYIWAVRGVPKPQAEEFMDACRSVVAPRMADVKQCHFANNADLDGRVACELTGERISFEDAHVDHSEPSFGQIVLAFRDTQGWEATVPAGVLSDPADAQTTTTFVSSSIAEAFQIFHDQRAQLRIIAAKHNIALGAGQRLGGKSR